MNNIKNMMYYCGCGGCESACKMNAIEMRIDERGFKKPYVLEGQCINCGKCLTVCPVNIIEARENSTFSQKCYAVKHLNANILSESQSGGLFTAISDYVLENKGVIYGVWEYLVFYLGQQLVQYQQMFGGSLMWSINTVLK